MPNTISYVVGTKPHALSLLRRGILWLKARFAGRELFTMPNQSMVSTLRLREVRELDSRAYQNGLVQRGDVVVYRSPKHDGLRLASRVVALSGETIELRGGILYINGAEIREPYVDSDAAEQEYSRTLAATTVPDSHVFLLGDFRDLSEDSRHIGALPSDCLVGRIVLRQ